MNGVARVRHIDRLIDIHHVEEKTAAELQPLSPRAPGLVFGERDPIELVWTDVSYEVDVGTKAVKTTRKILKEVSGSAAPGELVAIMGSSGAVSVCSRLG